MHDNLDDKKRSFKERGEQEESVITYTMMRRNSYENTRKKESYV